MLSIIIPACNEEKYLEQTINSIRSQNHENYEIIIVCDGCTDLTEEIAKKHTSKIIKLKQRQGPAIAKNRGAELSQGSKLIFLDADTHLTPGVLREIEKILEKRPNIVGTCRIKPSNKRLKHQILMLIKNYLLCPFGVSNGIIFCSKETFDKFKGFRNVKQMEDGFFIRAVKKKEGFKILKTPVINSTRRFDEIGYVKIWIYWIKKALKNNLNE